MARHQRGRYRKYGKATNVRRRYKRPGQLLRYRAPTTKDYAKSAFMGVRKLARFVNSEIKVKDTNITGSITSSGSVNKLCVISQGDGVSNREGNSVHPLNLSYRIFLIPNATPTQTAFRVIVFKGKGERGSSYTPIEILESTSMTSFKSISNRYDSRILYDKTYLLGNPSAGPVVSYDCGVLRIGGHISFDSTDATGATIDDGGLYVLLLSNQATNTPTISCNFRLTYTDN